MKRSIGLVWSLPLLALACSGGSTPAAETPAASEESPSTAPVAEAPKEPTAEEKAQAAQAAQLEKDMAAMEAESKAEADRWTPEMHTAAKKLAESKYYSVPGAYAAIRAGSHRMPGNTERDAARHPSETLSFMGLRPEMTVLEVGPGGGWYTEILAPMLAARGKLIATNADPNGAVTERATMYGKRFQYFLDKAPELYGKVEVKVVDGKQPALGMSETLDMALVIRGMHGWQNAGSVSTWLAELHKALKPGGVLGIVQHRAKAGADPVESAKKAYLPEQWVIDQVVAAGFELSKKSEINANPKDTTDYAEGVWVLPPTLALGDKDKERYVAIGESDRMTLRFVKPKAKK